MLSRHVIRDRVIRKVERKYNYEDDHEKGRLGLSEKRKKISVPLFLPVVYMILEQSTPIQTESTAAICLSN